MDRYRDSVEAIVIAIDHVSVDQLDRKPAHGPWTAREVVHHLADSELYESVRLRLMLAEKTPVLGHWDAKLYAERLHYERPVERALASFSATAHDNLELLHSLSEDQWRRDGNIQKPWPLTVETWLEENVRRLHDQLMQMLNATSGGRAIPDLV